MFARTSGSCFFPVRLHPTTSHSRAAGKQNLGHISGSSRRLDGQDVGLARYVEPRDLHRSHEARYTMLLMLCADVNEFGILGALYERYIVVVLLLIESLAFHPAATPKKTHRDLFEHGLLDSLGCCSRVSA